MFRDGWFYPGDVGVLHGRRRLQVIGRVDEILNIGGAKSSPEALEELILARTPIRQAGVCSIRNSAGIEEVCVAVADAAGGDQELLDWITRAFHGFQIGIFRVAKLAAIPRNAAGKIQRGVLKRDVMAAIESAR
jgi:acyl-CoA synthetase (AMP-forming)/AMP-acid ligase II